MRCNLSDKFAEELINFGIIDSENRELYSYGIHAVFGALLNIITAIFIGFLFGMIMQSVIFMAAYIPIRIFSGGYHAHTQVQCYLLSVILIVGSLLLMRYIPWTLQILLFSSFFSGMIVFFLSPIPDSNKPLNEMELVIYRKYARIILGMELILEILMLILGLNWIAACIVLALLSDGLLMIIGKLTKVKLKSLKPLRF